MGVRELIEEYEKQIADYEGKLGALSVDYEYLLDKTKELEAQIPQWLAIESAPENEQLLLCGGLIKSICCGSSEWEEAEKDAVYMGERYSGDDYYMVNDYFYIKPTYYMPLPTPPKKES